MEKEKPVSQGLLPPPRLLAAGRALAGISQRDLAKAAGVSSTSLARYESGAATMRTDSLGAVVAVLRGLRVRFVGESRDAEVGLLLVKEGRGKARMRLGAE